MTSDFIFTRSSKKMADRYNLSPEALAVVDLVAAGWAKEEAFTLVYRVGMTWTKQALATELANIFQTTGARKRKKFLKGHYTEEDVSEENTPARRIPENVMDAVSKENMLAELVEAKKGMTVGSKDWLDVNKMIADITRMKQDEVRTEDTTVHFFLPMQCYQCELYLRNKKGNDAQGNK